MKFKEQKLIYLLTIPIVTMLITAFIIFSEQAPIEKCMYFTGTKAGLLMLLPMLGIAILSAILGYSLAILPSRKIEWYEALGWGLLIIMTVLMILNIFGLI